MRERDGGRENAQRGGQVDAIVIYFPAADYNITQAGGIRSRNADANATETSYTESTRRNLRPGAVFYSYAVRAPASAERAAAGSLSAFMDIRIYARAYALYRYALLSACVIVKEKTSTSPRMPYD